ncbi:uroporphyrinogen-III synthase [Halobacillus sp. K22]|uniref:uroporphyrinogen-III synthase n=1 Tax=Halobacillus sp. K22 TaxID=3457431 RepID=UPI003FCD4541
MSGLQGKRVAVAADRRAEEIGTLIRNFGGEPVVYSIQGKMNLDETTSAANVQDLISGSFDWVILTTGIGARTLADSARRNELHEDFIDKLKRSRLAIRGKKTTDWMKEHNLEPERLAADGTMAELMHELEASPERGSVFLQAYNLDDAKWKSTLEEMGYDVYLSQPYSFEKPKAANLQELKMEIFDQSVEAVIFTSKTQVKNLFEDTEDQEMLTRQFNDQVLAVAVGKVTAKELADQRINEVLQPKNQKMGAMVVNLNQYFTQLSESY